MTQAHSQNQRRLLNSTRRLQDKNKRLYCEVRYAKNLCLSLKHTASVFRLKRDYRNLSSKEYVDNLCQYLGDARSKAVLTAGDLKKLLLELDQEIQIEKPNAATVESPPSYSPLLNRFEAGSKLKKGMNFLQDEIWLPSRWTKRKMFCPGSLGSLSLIPQKQLTLFTRIVKIRRDCAGLSRG